MNKLTKMIVAAVGAAVMTAAPAVANADRVYFLVGTRHVYRIGHYQYEHVDERRAIEQDYADQVAADDRTYNDAIQNGADPAVEGPQLNQALTDLAIDRDNKLAALYQNADYERVRHPELQIEGDGPYQVMAINFHWRGTFEVFDNFCVYAPWPGYVVVNRPYGWVYGVSYTPAVFVNVYIGWHATYVSAGSPAFVGFVGRGGPVFVSGIARGPGGGFVHREGVGGPGSFNRGGGWQGNRTRPGTPPSRPVGTSRYGNPTGQTRSPIGGGAASNYNRNRTTTNPSGIGQPGGKSAYNRGTTGNPSTFGGSRPATPSGYTHGSNPAATRPTPGHTSPAQPSKYSHSASSKPASDPKKKGGI